MSGERFIAAAAPSKGGGATSGSSGSTTIQSVTFGPGSVSINFVYDLTTIVTAIAGLGQKLDLLLLKDDQIISKEGEIMATLADLLTDVQDETNVVTSAVALLGNLSQMLKDALAAGGSPAQIQAVIDLVDANKAALAAGVAANTPAAPPGP